MVFFVHFYRKAVLSW